MTYLQTVQQQQSTEVGEEVGEASAPLYNELRGRLPVRYPNRPDLYYPARNLDRVSAVDIHYTAGPSTQTVTEVARYQVGPGAQEAFPGIAYHFMVTHDGTVHYVNDVSLRVWHNGAPGRNSTAVGICYTGNREPNQAQKEGIKRAISLSEHFVGRPLTVSGHKDHYATACPGPTWPAWKPEILP